MVGGVSWVAGDYVAWGPVGRVSVVRLTVVDRWHVSYLCEDGVAELVDATVFRSLEQLTVDWRRATEQEVAAYQGRYRPAPQNWH